MMNKEQLKKWAKSLRRCRGRWQLEEQRVTEYEQLVNRITRRSAMMPQRWEVVDGMLKPTDKLSPKKKNITHKMDMT